MKESNNEYNENEIIQNNNIFIKNNSNDEFTNNTYIENNNIFNNINNKFEE